MAQRISLRPPLNLVRSSWKWQSRCQDGDGDTETEFLQLLQEPVRVFWRKVPMFTLQFYFGKSAAGCTVVFGQAKKVRARARLRV